MLSRIDLLIAVFCLLLCRLARPDPIGTGGPAAVPEGSDALLTCLVMGPFYNDTVMWRKGPNEILSAGMNRVTSDRRISILHDDSPKGRNPTGGDVWVLLIKDTRPSDTAVYVCEVNSDPVIRSFHPLRVKSASGVNSSTVDSPSKSKKKATTGKQQISGKRVQDEQQQQPSSVSDGLEPPTYSTAAPFEPMTASAAGTGTPTAIQLTHDFSDCCGAWNVSQACMGFCSVSNIIDGTAGVEPEICEKDFPNIVRCMADGRNHVPCCEKNGVADLCQDMCRGEYMPFTDLLKSRVSCVAHTLPALRCILQGIQNLPSEPENVFVEPLTEKSLQISWSPPARFAETVNKYTINISVLHSFDQDSLAGAMPSQQLSGASSSSSSSSSASYSVTKNDTIATIGGVSTDLVGGTSTPATAMAAMATMATMATMASVITVIVPGDLDSTVINDLEPFTMYSITVTAHNEYGSSLPSYRVRTLTLESSISKQTTVATVPQLPDVRSCCLSHGMTHRNCLDRMCDPKKADYTGIPDLMVCAPWANITFSCLANKIDHSPCCKSRGIPDSCLPFCAGTITAINFNLFKCLQYMSEYSSCLLQGYGVLAGPPARLKAPLVAAHFAVLEWSSPKILPDTVTSYQLHLRKLGSGEEYSTVEKDHPPIILEDLDAGSHYEAFIVAVNAHGKGGPSPRLVFQTKHDAEMEVTQPAYNISSCCFRSGLLPQCMPLCSYDVKTTDLRALGSTCRPQTGVLVRCGAGGRDHTPCCNRRSVPPKCMSLCRGVVTEPPIDCMSYAGNIIQCYEEGTDQIPPPIEDLHATQVANNSIAIEWLPTTIETILNNNSTVPSPSAAPLSTNTIDYLVQYGKVNDMTMYETVVKLENELNTTRTECTLTNLEANSLYRILVVARNIYGTSLPSSMLLINTTVLKSTNDNNSIVYGAPSPPHSLAVTSHSATWVTVTWLPPEFSHPHETITYKIYHKPTAASEFSLIETRLLSTRVNGLNPNSQHVIYVTAIGGKGPSLPSETLVAWTDPALPAFVDPPTIHPTDIVSEGGSMTILCLALGNPAPTISLYVGGHLVRQDTSRHMVTVIHNVSTDMEHVSCYADNGFGIPMQASKRVNISYAPRIQASGITVASIDEEVDLRCTVKARPQPKVMFWRDHDGRIPVIQGGNYDMSLSNDVEDGTLFTMTLRIAHLNGQDAGDYFCHAENALGSATRPVSVRMRNTPAIHNISECCVANNVSAACMPACSFYIDIDAVIDRPECIVDFDKLMRCAADGSDHRTCCGNSDVPRRCLNWCRGEPLGNGELCALQHTRTIIGCFQANRERLPGPPQNVQFKVLSDTDVDVGWLPPLKNPHTVDGYRVFWHALDPIVEQVRGGGMATGLGIATTQVDAQITSIQLKDLHQNVMYELVVKAANQFGASVLSEPIRFTIGDNHITSASPSSSAGTVSGILAGIIAICLAAGALYVYNKRRGASRKAANGVAFENPSYLREVNMEHVHIPAVSAETTTDWRQEILQAASHNGNELQISGASHNVPMATEVNPSLYEELKLGHDGAGFKRLVS